MTKLRVVKMDRHGPAFLKKDVDAIAKETIENGTYFGKRMNTMTKDVDAATQALEDMMDKFSAALDRFTEMEKTVAESAKRASGSVRDANDKLAAGVSKIEKTANFARLEQYTLLLERSAAAMTTLATLEESGKLTKISAALK